MVTCPSSTCTACASLNDQLTQARVQLDHHVRVGRDLAAALQQHQDQKEKVSRNQEAAPGGAPEEAVRRLEALVQALRVELDEKRATIEYDALSLWVELLITCFFDRSFCGSGQGGATAAQLESDLATSRRVASLLRDQKEKRDEEVAALRKAEAERERFVEEKVAMERQRHEESAVQLTAVWTARMTAVEQEMAQLTRSLTEARPFHLISVNLSN